jgi:hypothetical protein
MFDELFEGFEGKKRRHGKGHGHDGYGRPMDYDDENADYKDHKGDRRGPRRGDEQDLEKSGHGYDDEQGRQRGHGHGMFGGHGGHHIEMLRKIPRPVLVVGGILILGAGTVVLLLMMPLLKQGWSFVMANGLKGVVDAISPLLGKLWEGGGK